MYQVYRVTDGDTFESISKCFNCSCDDLIRLNGLNDLISDSFIVVPKNSFYSSYVVESGDTLYDISKKYDIDLGVLYAINGLDDGDIIYPNQELIIPDNVSMYLTKSGDTFENIFSRLSYDISDFINDNGNLELMADQIVVYKRD